MRLPCPHHAINEQANQYSSYSSGVLNLGVANSVSQTIYFDHVASVNDGVRVRLGLSNSLIGLGIANLNAVNFVAYNGSSETPVWSGNLYSLAELLGLDLLNLVNLGSNHKELDVVFKPEVEFNRVKIEFNAGLLGLGVLGDALRVYNVSLAPAAPEISSADQPLDVAICEGEMAVFEAVASVPPGGILSYQWQYLNGSTWQDISGATSTALSLTDVPLAFNENKYRLRVDGGNASCPQTIYSDPAMLTVDLKPGKPHLTIREVIN